MTYIIYSDNNVIVFKNYDYAIKYKQENKFNIFLEKQKNYILKYLKNNIQPTKLFCTGRLKKYEYIRNIIDLENGTVKINSIKEVENIKITLNPENFDKLLMETFAIKTIDIAKKLNIIRMLTKCVKNNIDYEEIEDFCLKNFDNYQNQFAINCENIYESIKNASNLKDCVDFIFKDENEYQIPSALLEKLCLIALSFNKQKDVIKIFEPCCGKCCFSKAFTKMCNSSNPDIKLEKNGSEINESIAYKTEINNTLDDFEIEIKNEDFIDTIQNIKEDIPDQFSLFDFGLLDPPIDKKNIKGILEKSNDKQIVLDLMRRNAVYSKISINIIPENSIKSSSEIQHFKQIIGCCEIPLILRLGNKVFYKQNEGKQTKNILAIFTILKEKYNPSKPIMKDEFNAVVYDLNLDKMFTTTRKQEKKFADDSIFNDIIEHYVDSPKQIFKLSEREKWFEKNLNPIDIMRQKLKIDDNDIEILKTEFEQQYFLKSLNTYFNTGDTELLFEIPKSINTYSNDRFKRINFSDYFEKLKSKSSIKKIECSEGAYNVIGHSNLNNGIIGHCPNFDYPASNENPIFTMAYHSSGDSFFFKQTVPFRCTDYVYLFRLKQSFPNEDFNIDLINVQLQNTCLGYENRLTAENLKKFSVYIII